MPEKKGWMKLDRRRLKKNRVIQRGEGGSACACRGVCEEGCIWTCAVESQETQMCLGFQVANVKKQLILVKRIVEKGNHVSFGPKEDDNYIINKDTGDKMMLRPNGKGSYLMEVSFVGGGRTEITVDSGAEENVCPWEWGELFEVKEADRWKNFRNASGGHIEHHVSRDVLVTSPF